jgi:hypothetical protein
VSPFGLAVDNTTRTIARATLIPAAGSASVPGPLPILGVAAAFGFSRKLRERIKDSKLPATRTLLP